MSSDPVRFPAASAAVLALVALSLIWGYNFVVMKMVLDYIDPLDFTAARTLLGALSVFGFALLTRQALVRPPWRVMVLIGVLQTALFSLLIQWALVGADAGRTVFVVYSMPFWLTALAAAFLGERLGWMRLAILLMAAVGLVLLIQPWAMAETRGLWLALGAGFIWAVAAVIQRRAPKSEGQTLLSMTAWQLLLGAVVLSGLALLIPSEPPKLEAQLFWSLAYGSLLATGVAWALWLFILERMSAAGAGFSMLLVPLVGLSASWLQLGERPNAMGSLGIALLVAGLVAFAVLGLRNSAPKPTEPERLVTKPARR